MPDIVHGITDVLFGSQLPHHEGDSKPSGVGIAALQKMVNDQIDLLNHQFNGHYQHVDLSNVDLSGIMSTLADLPPEQAAQLMDKIAGGLVSDLPGSGDAPADIKDKIYSIAKDQAANMGVNVSFDPSGAPPASDQPATSADAPAQGTGTGDPATEGPRRGFSSDTGKVAGELDAATQAQDAAHAKDAADPSRFTKDAQGNVVPQPPDASQTKDWTGAAKPADPAQDHPGTGPGTGHVTSRIQDFDMGAADAQDYQKITGRDPTQAYSDYVASFSDAGGRRGQAKPKEKWLREQASIAMGPVYAAVRNLQIWYQNQYGEAMPDALRNEVEDYFKSDPSNAAVAQGLALESAGSSGVAQITNITGQTQNIPLDQAGTKGQADMELVKSGDDITTHIPGLKKKIEQYVAAHPTKDTENAAIDSGNRTSFRSAIGRDPTDAELTQMRTMGSTQLGEWMDGITVNNTNLKYGQYRAADGLAQNLWGEFYAGATPTQADVQHIAGFKDKQQARDWVESQPSHISGMNIGNYTGLHKAAGEISAKLWNIPAGPDIMKHVTDKAMSSK